MVVNRAKLAYNAVAAWLEGKSDPPAKLAAVAGLAENLRLQDRVAQALRQRRHQQGALELETLEPRAVFQGDAVSDLRLEQQNRAKQLIEDFMVAANVTTARFLEKKGFPVGAAGAALAGALGADRRARRRPTARSCPASPTRGRWRAS